MQSAAFRAGADRRRYGVTDYLLFGGGKVTAIRGPQHESEELKQEFAVRRGIGQRQRIEAGGLAGDEDFVLAAHGADEDLGAPVLVDEERVSALA